MLNTCIYPQTNHIELNACLFEIQAIADDITSKYVPPHVNIFYCLGRITLTCFLV